MVVGDPVGVAVGDGVAVGTTRGPLHAKIAKLNAVAIASAAMAPMEILTSLILPRPPAGSIMTRVRPSASS
jgi:hypothetical protein